MSNCSSSATKRQPKRLLSEMVLVTGARDSASWYCTRELNRAGKACSACWHTAKASFIARSISSNAKSAYGSSRRAAYSNTDARLKNSPTPGALLFLLGFHNLTVSTLCSCTSALATSAPILFLLLDLLLMLFIPRLTSFTVTTDFSPYCTNTQLTRFGNHDDLLSIDFPDMSDRQAFKACPQCFHL